MNRTKQKGKLEPAQFLEEEKSNFQRNIAFVISEHDIPTEFNIDQLPLSPRKYTFDFQGAKLVPIKGVDGKLQIVAGEFFPMQLKYEGKTEQCS